MKAQLALPFAVLPTSTPTVVVTPVAAAIITPNVMSSSSSATPPVSRTRLIIEAIQARLPGARVVIVDTRSVLLSQALKDGVRTVRVHQMFLDADADVRLAMGLYLATGHAAAGAVIDAFIKQRTYLLDYAARPLKSDAGRGAVYDLDAAMCSMNQRYFNDAIGAEICWGQAGATSRRRRRSITFGSYDHRAKRITMHPVLDRAEVPALVVMRIVHHEMLHEKHGEAHGDTGRRIVHSKAFRAEEATFDGALAADAWIEAHLDELLRWNPRSPSRSTAGTAHLF